MKLSLTAAVFSLFLFGAPAPKYYLLIGTYDSPKSEGVYVYTFDTNDGTASELSHIKTPNPSYLAVSPDEKFVYAVHESGKETQGGDIVALSFNKHTGALTYLNKQPSGGDHPCYVEVDKTGQWVFAGNYSSGSLSLLGVDANGGLLEHSMHLQHTGNGKDPKRQESPHVHCTKISPDNKTLFVADLGTDKVYHYDFDAKSGKLMPANDQFTPSDPGSGPRHFIFHPSNKFAYLVEELSGTVVVHTHRKGKLTRIQRISTMPEGDKAYPGSADIQVSPDGNFLYASNRGNANTIAIYQIDKRNGTLTMNGLQSTLGKTPRNFTIDPTGKYLLIANQNSDEIVIFMRDIRTGLLTDTGKRISVGKPVCLKWVSM